jgi:seryl-tRNA synthetase
MKTQASSLIIIALIIAAFSYGWHTSSQINKRLQQAIELQAKTDSIYKSIQSNIELSNSRINEIQETLKERAKEDSLAQIQLQSIRYRLNRNYNELKNIEKSFTDKLDSIPELPQL